MTALTVPAHPDSSDAGLRPLPWRRAAGVTWRQHRFALVAVTTLLGTLAVVLWIIGLQLHHAYAAVTACHPAGSSVCQAMVHTFNGMDTFLANGIILQVIPPLVGAFVGAPVLARELETGTFRYAWTQGFGRCRWALAKLVLLAATLVTATAAFGVLLSWYYQPYFATRNQALGLTELSPFNVCLFDLHPLAFPAWTLAAFAIGALAGTLIRRVVPAILATLAIYAGLAFAVGVFLREHYLAPLVTSSLNLPVSSMIVRQWGTKNGTFAFAFNHGLPPMNVIPANCPGPLSGYHQKPSMGSLLECVVQQGYTLRTSYQPGSRFWPFQWIEGGWLFALSALLIAASIWLVRRRAA